ncbi:Pycsar system effector family protein [Mucilaginibacter glaciei]|uniref:HD domain-containing protein n=1 Tax=Mucilaginibacter glaciei TaxID=2772109 RepID=A0A926RZB8_9SPHI|nr:Pycsar system effector family protein [Mucilaginibacter glaciei]MBD1391705.1 HD domain-containing protein [Mucilaginibacter glaciei]
MNYQHLLKQVNEYTLDYYKQHTNPTLIYHSKQHTEYVAGKATQIANHYQLNDRDFFVVVAAAWFHDLGYMVDMKAHEEESAKLADAFLKERKVDDAVIKDIDDCIMATKMPQSPRTQLQQIICDADLFHLGTDDFADKDKLLHNEVENISNTEISKQEWRVKSITFLQGHHYHTDYAQLLLSDGKQKNLNKLQEKVDAKNKKDEKKDLKEKKQPEEVPGLMMDYSTVADKPATVDTPKDSKSKKEKADKQDKGVQTMFRISSANHQRLSDMADNKAHIMITVNSIILSAIISLLLRRLGEYEYLTVPTFILLTVSLLAMTFSILATRPSIPPGTFTRDDVDEKKVNLLFFGNFYKMGLDEYAYGMTKMMHDTDFLYDSLIKDVYAQGVVLGKKYRLLRIAYNIFMFGLIGSVVAFIIASALFSSK